MPSRFPVAVHVFILRAIREAREEVGVTLARDRLRVVGVMHRKSADERVDFFLTYRLDGETVSNAEPHKCSELMWARPSSLPGDVIPYVRAALETFPESGWFQEFGWETAPSGVAAEDRPA